MPTVTIRVTRRAIRWGITSPLRCPIAIALKDQGFVKPWVGRTSVRAEGLINPQALPEAARHFVELFDEGAEDLTPFSFQLEIP